MNRFNQLEAYGPRLLSILRIMAGLMLIQHGTQKLFGFPAPPANGLPAVGSLLWVGAIIELVGGALFALGLFTRPVAFLLAGQLAVSYWMFHAPRGFYPVLNAGELAALYCFVFLLFVGTGPGPWSLDARADRDGTRTYA